MKRDLPKRTPGASLLVRILELEAQLADRDAKLAGLHRSYEELEETATECLLLHSPRRPEVRRGC